ncbi:MAG TPA: ribosome biogenesis factor YjgA [Steroidobacteraceae bacterium]|mgnify:CR=1 FL=1|jgi:ribosome-associated protein
MQDFDDSDERPSKSELKRQSAELQALGEALIDLPQSELDALPLPENLRDAVELARRITAHGGLYRQKQYIGKLMRKIDAEPIRRALAAKREKERLAALRFRNVEHWRDRLIAEGSQALEAFRAATPAQFDAAMLERLIDRARDERRRGGPPRASRELFRALREILDPSAGKAEPAP